LRFSSGDELPITYTWWDTEGEGEEEDYPDWIRIINDAISNDCTTLEFWRPSAEVKCLDSNETKEVQDLEHGSRIEWIHSCLEALEVYSTKCFQGAVCKGCNYFVSYRPPNLTGTMPKPSNLCIILRGKQLLMQPLPTIPINVPKATGSILLHLFNGVSMEMKTFLSMRLNASAVDL
jgi:hypothetical protein